MSSTFLWENVTRSSQKVQRKQYGIFRAEGRSCTPKRLILREIFGNMRLNPGSDAHLTFIALAFTMYAF